MSSSKPAVAVMAVAVILTILQTSAASRLLRRKPGRAGERVRWPMPTEAPSKHRHDGY